MNVRQLLAPLLLFTGVLLGAGSSFNSWAEVSEINIAGGFGITNLPIMVMQKQKLIEKHASELGIGKLKANYATLAGGSNLNDALISGAVDVGFPSPTALLVIWAKTRGSLDVRAISAVSSMPLYLNTRDSAVKTVKDFTPADRIAMPGVTTTIQAVLLQMAAAKALGENNAHKLDALTRAVPHPEAATALITGSAGITAHFGSPPYQYQELEQPTIHTVLDSYQILGGPATFVLAIATGKFYKKNPTVAAAFYGALKESINWINSHKPEAAQVYLEFSHDKRSSTADIVKMLNDPKIVFTLTPQRTMEYADFMQKVGLIKLKPKTWKDMFFPTAYQLPGS
jgi:NitT/TauT family transport system substrate-binding protein